MGSLTDDDEDDDEEFVPYRDKEVQPKELKSGRLIGKGRSSIVYETTWKGQSYARKDFLRVPSDVFEREAEVLAGLDEHPNVTRTHCWSVSEASCSLVVDLMDDDLQNVMRNRRESAWQSLSPQSGSDATSHVIDLHRFVEDAAPELRHPVASTLLSTFSMSEALHIMLQIAEGIVFLHDSGVAHGDLKPKNILVAPSEQGARSLGLFHVKMADFGLVETKMKSKTLASQRARKLEIARWRAPELFEYSYLLRSEDSDSDWDSDSGDHDGGVHTYEKLWRGDVYSFAVTCAQILTGEDPYSGLGLRELVSRISGPNGLRPGLPQPCPAQLSDLINRCWGDELKRPSFIDIRSELKDVQASLMSDSYVIRETILALSGRLVFEVQRDSELTSSNPPAPTLPRGDLEITEAVGGLPVKADTFSIKSNEGLFLDKLGCIPAKFGSMDEEFSLSMGKGKRQADRTLSSQNGEGYPVGKRHRLTDRVRIMAGSVKWSYLEMEDHLKCRFWELFSGSRAKCNNRDCPTCYSRAFDVPQPRDGRLSTLLQKIRTLPKFGSRRIRDHTTQEKLNSFGPSPQSDRLKAASFPVKHKDLSRARFLPRFKKFESIREESVQPPPKENEVLYMNVVGLEIAAAQDADATPSVEDLGKYSYSFGSDSLSFNRDDSIAKDLSMAKDGPSMAKDLSMAKDVSMPTIRSSTLGYVPAAPAAAPAAIAVPAVSSEVSESAGPDTAWNGVGSEVSATSAQPGYGNAWQTQQGDSPLPKPCGAAQGDTVPQSRFSGVRWKAKKWTSEIRPTGAKKTVWLGTYATEEEAASAYDAGIFYFDKPKNYNFEDSESFLPKVNPTLDERSQLNFIKTQARFIAKRRAANMAQDARSFQPGTPDTFASGAGPAVSGSSRSRLSFLPSFSNLTQP